MKGQETKEYPNNIYMLDDMPIEIPIKRAKPRQALTPEQHKMVEEHINLVAQVVNSKWSKSGLYNTGVQKEDLMGNAYLALINAVQKHDPNRGPLEAYARQSIKNSIIATCKANSHYYNKHLALNFGETNEETDSFTASKETMREASLPLYEHIIKAMAELIEPHVSMPTALVKKGITLEILINALKAETKAGEIARAYDVPARDIYTANCQIRQAAKTLRPILIELVTC